MLDRLVNILDIAGIDGQWYITQELQLSLDHELHWEHVFESLA